MRVAEGSVQQVKIGPEDLAAILGPRKFEAEVAMRSGVPGVATGLAWTPVGGDILFVEAARMPGAGKLILTGQLGDVMKESAQAALTLARTWTGDATGTNNPVAVVLNTNKTVQAVFLGKSNSRGVLAGCPQKLSLRQECPNGRAALVLPLRQLAGESRGTRRRFGHPLDHEAFGRPARSSGHLDGNRGAIPVGQGEGRCIVMVVLRGGERRHREREQGDADCSAAEQTSAGHRWEARHV
jgi:hypothetical protein